MRGYPSQDAREARLTAAHADPEFLEIAEGVIAGRNRGRNNQFGVGGGFDGVGVEAVKELSRSITCSEACGDAYERSPPRSDVRVQPGEGDHIVQFGESHERVQIGSSWIEFPHGPSQEVSHIVG